MQQPVITGSARAALRILTVCVGTLALGLVLLIASYGISAIDYAIQDSAGEPGPAPAIVGMAAEAGHTVLIIGSLATIAACAAFLGELRRTSGPAR
ncbi:hypothetical protein [Brevibacterium luteolum]|uniref:Uncharacterized protein n=1 Tax=Brevibacterium luteolum TaxID=199591 RepID=A0A2N6PGP2_9MICO|nr:hypothetical protein [Brevibacterium luteolum]MCT1874696.1 hypothetical protein [Brevibacterium luteolum]MCT1891819.1 hypothetical protein [Brevibacterium luteolum]MCT1894386.1 hypothetical protein [Brevibacterium luteolum]MCT1925034.1 hypothetical protein [Brevibacterium luteolum]PMB97846.1 hypothetical protein CJ198_08420 [Brevibacterium luteolum]